MLAMFGAKDCEALEARLVRGEGPTARRLRHLAATLPIGEAPRLEQMRLVVDRRPAGVNLRCARISGPEGAPWLLLSVPALGGASDEPPAPAKDPETPRRGDVATPNLAVTLPPQRARAPPSHSRFLWTLDEDGCFGESDPVLVAAVGANAPCRGESVDALLGRAGLTGGDELVRVLEHRQTFSGVTVEWPLSGFAGRRLIELFAAPMFGRQREFLGYRGFGVLGAEIEAGPAPGGEVLPELAEDHRSEPTEVFEPEIFSAGMRSGSRGPDKRKRRGPGRAESRIHADRRSRRRALFGLPRGGWKRHSSPGADLAAGGRSRSRGSGGRKRGRARGTEA